MANEQTTVPLFVAAEVLTAADMNLSAGTGVPVFSNSTTRDAGFGGAGEKVLAEGQLCYLSDSNIVQYYSGSAWATVGPASAGGLVLVKAETAFTGQSSFNVASVFSATYTNYRILIRSQAATGGGGVALQLSSGGVATASGYNFQRGLVYGSNFAAARSTAQTSFSVMDVSTSTATNSQISIDIFSPFSGIMTYTSQNSLTDGGYTSPIVDLWAGNNGSSLSSQDGFFIKSLTGTITGSYTVYGYAKS
tara:strand:+ start:1210 stop:1956 length:747 start_codon:yes stop_codon:yes gene_type:complete